MPGWRTPTTDTDRPAELSVSTVNVLLLGWAKAPIAPADETGRWQLAFMTPDQIGELYQQHRPWLLREAAKRGIRRPWGEQVYGRGPRV